MYRPGARPCEDMRQHNRITGSIAARTAIAAKQMPPMIRG